MKKSIIIFLIGAGILTNAVAAEANATNEANVTAKIAEVNATVNSAEANVTTKIAEANVTATKVVDEANKTVDANVSKVKSVLVNPSNDDIYHVEQAITDKHEEHLKNLPQKEARDNIQAIDKAIADKQKEVNGEVKKVFSNGDMIEMQPANEAKETSKKVEHKAKEVKHEAHHKVNESNGAKIEKAVDANEAKSNQAFELIMENVEAKKQNNIEEVQVSGEAIVL